MVHVSFQSILSDVEAERFRQEELCALGKFEHTCAHPEWTDRQRLPVLVEEVGEVARAIQTGDLDNLREELVQVAAVAVAWVEAIDALK